MVKSFVELRACINGNDYPIQRIFSVEPFDFIDEMRRPGNSDRQESTFAGLASNAPDPHMVEATTPQEFSCRIAASRGKP
jgi:hypothetical protein